MSRQICMEGTTHTVNGFCCIGFKVEDIVRKLGIQFLLFIVPVGGTLFDVPWSVGSCC